MEITTEFLQSELAAARQEVTSRQQGLAMAIGACQTLEQMIAMMDGEESPPDEPEAADGDDECSSPSS